MKVYNSIGMVEYGNNNIFEVMKEKKTGTIYLVSHDDYIEPLNDEGDYPYSKYYICPTQFLADCASFDDFQYIKQDFLEVVRAAL